MKFVGCPYFWGDQLFERDYFRPKISSFPNRTQRIWELWPFKPITTPMCSCKKRNRPVEVPCLHVRTTSEVQG